VKGRIFCPSVILFAAQEQRYFLAIADQLPHTDDFVSFAKQPKSMIHNAARIPQPQL
jgi:hypothetical protein